jgi:hypothetical protein
MANASPSCGLQKLARDAERAGAVMGCHYLSSDEYEAELIAERRRAGAYGRPKRYSLVLLTAILAVTLLSMVVLTL